MSAYVSYNEVIDWSTLIVNPDPININILFGRDDIPVFPRELLKITRENLKIAVYVF